MTNNGDMPVRACLRVCADVYVSVCVVWCVDVSHGRSRWLVGRGAFDAGEDDEAQCGSGAGPRGHGDFEVPGVLYH